MKVFQKKGQLTIFIIVGLVIVAGILIYLLLPNFSGSTLNKDFQPAHDYYLSCLDDRLEKGVTILGQQGGHLYVEDLTFEAGSEYMPFSSQLDYLGIPVPYWIYVSGNNIYREQKPTLSDMEIELERFLEEGLSDCDFSNFNNQGIFIDIFEGEVELKINENSIEFRSNNPVYFSSENQTALVDDHSFDYSTKLGKFYSIASEIYEKEKSDTFLEYYTLDIMRLYAPVTGVEVDCAPLVFNEFEVREDIVTALEENTQFLKVKGNYYKLSNPDNSYFVVELDENVNENVNFVYSSDWPTRVEMYGDKIVQPVGNQEGLGVLGFCFVPYHFVYDITHPVLVQIYDNEESFQFPVGVVIKNSQARENFLSENEYLSEDIICSNANKEVEISAYDLDLNPVEASFKFRCLTETCNAGTSDFSQGTSSVMAKLPTCVNGVLSAYAEGYAPASYLISTNSESRADILMKKIHTVNVDLGNVDLASVVFSSEDYTSAINYPEQKTIKLVEGEYNITAFVYEDSTISFPGVVDRKCFDVPSTSLSGIFGDTEEQCFDVEIPEQEIEKALVGGGRVTDYLFEDQLKNSQELNINIPLFGKPTNLIELQDNYADWEVSSLNLIWE